MEQKTTFVFGPIQTQWLESLEQNPDRQLSGRLGIKLPDGTYKACCLGELAIIAGCANWDKDTLIVLELDGISRNIAALPNAQELGLNSSLGHDKDLNKSLAAFNDNGTSWPEIAKIVRANPEAYFTKSV